MLICVFQALGMNKYDAWATHALTHVLEMEGRQTEGIQFLSSTEHEWNVRAFSF